MKRSIAKRTSAKIAAKLRAEFQSRCTTNRDSRDMARKSASANARTLGIESGCRLHQGCLLPWSARLAVTQRRLRPDGPDAAAPQQARCLMRDGGSFQHLDRTRPGPRRRAVLWVAVCVVLVVGLVGSVAGD
jgi:hypothetical protein